ncbi:MAG: CotH kinase family protein, partial [Huintestinicola sp.]
MKRLLVLIFTVSLVFVGCSNGNTEAENAETTGQTGYASATAAEVTSEITAANVTEAAVTSETTAASEEEKPELSENGFSSPEMEEQYFGKKDSLKALYDELASVKNMPSINITTLNEDEILSKEEYVTSVIDVFNCDDEYILSAEAGVKVRGNSTADQSPDKPYRIKFTEKQNMLGLHEGKEYKSWVLLRSYWNLCPDYMAFHLAEAIFENKYYSSDCTYVNLFLNSQYAGMYLLAEQNQAAADRIDVYEPSEEETQIEIGYVLELDNYAGEEHPFFKVVHGDGEFTDINGETRRFRDKEYSVRSDISSDEQLGFIEKYTSGVYEILWQAVQNNKAMMFDSEYNVVPADDTYSSAEEAVSAVIDLESLVNMLILEELVQNYDVGAGSFYMAVDLSPESRYEKMTFLAPWDFNWAYMEDPDSGYYAGAFQKPADDGIDRSNPWLTTAMKADWFRELVKEKWSRLSAGGTLDKVMQQVADDITLLENDLGTNAWSIDGGMAIVDFVNRRIEWLDTQWG